MSGDELLALYRSDLARRALAKETVRQRLGTARRFLAVLERPVEELRRADVRAFLAARVGKLAPTSAAAVVGCLRDLGRFLKREGVLAEDPCETLPVPCPPRPLAVLLGLEDVARLLTESLEEPVGRKKFVWSQAIGQRDRAVVERLFATGVRVSELVRATVLDLDLVAGTILVRRSKRGASGVLPLPARAVLHLEHFVRVGRPILARQRDRGGEALFLTRFGEALGVEGVRRIVKRLSRRLGLRAHPHAFRRSLATALVRGGVSLVLVQELLGHRSVASTERYVEVDRAELHEAVARLDSSLGGA